MMMMMMVMLMLMLMMVMMMRRRRMSPSAVGPGTFLELTMHILIYMQRFYWCCRQSQGPW
jgi:hypothetical protein